MLQLKKQLVPAALLMGGLLLGACGGNTGHDAPTTTPTSTLGTDSASTKVGGMPPDTAGMHASPAGTAPGGNQ